MRIYISSSREDLSVARNLANQLPSHPTLADVGEVIVYTPLDNLALAGTDDTSSGEWQEAAARAERQMADSGYIVLLLSPAAQQSPWVTRDLDQVSRLRSGDAMKFIVKVTLQPIPPTPALDGLQSIDAVSRPLDEVVAEVAYYATSRPRQTGGRTVWAPMTSLPDPSDSFDQEPPFAPGAG